MKKERCRVCGKKVRVQIQKNTGYCCAQHQEQDPYEDAVDIVRDAEEI